MNPIDGIDLVRVRVCLFDDLLLNLKEVSDLYTCMCLLLEYCSLANR
jgi:hypothetical protein